MWWIGGMGHRKVPRVLKLLNGITREFSKPFMKEYIGRMHPFNIALLTVCLISILASPLYSYHESPVTVAQTTSSELCFVLNNEVHNRVGAAYPLTYHVALPANSQNLKAFKKHSAQDEWQELVQKSYTDFFNGIEAARFDYDSNRVFISIAFKSGKDSIWLKISDHSGTIVIPHYAGITPYYDNRRAVVTITADDWADWSDSMFPELMHMFRSRNLFVTGGVISRFDWTSPATWVHLQKQLDSGYFEVASHSQTHPHTPYAAADSEVAGSYDDITSNLALPGQFRNGEKEFVYVWIAPYGDYDGVVDSVVAAAGYLVSRMYFIDDADVSPWNASKKMFVPTGLTLEIGAPSWGGGTIDTTFMKNTFNTIVGAGGVYHLMWHPQVIYPDRNNKYLQQHLDYISNRNDLWYANFGHLYLYRLLQQEYVPTINDVKKTFTTAYEYILEQNYPNPFNPSTTIRYQLRKPGKIRLTVVDALGREVAVLADEYQASGFHHVSFEGKSISSGLYFYRLSVDGKTEVKKMALIK